MPEAEYYLELDSVSREYPAPGGGPGVAVLRAVNLRLRAGQAAAIVGPSGSGKSTLLNLIGALDRPTAGRIRLGGQELGNLSAREQARVRAREVGFVFQDHHLLPQCTVLENVLVPTLAPDAPCRGREATAAAERWLARVGLGERLTHRPAQLSGGERQRVAVVRALINGPRLLLADEPTGSLDHAAAVSLGDLLVELNREAQVTMLVVTHALALAARFELGFELRDGQLQERHGP